MGEFGGGVVGGHWYGWWLYEDGRGWECVAKKDERLIAYVDRFSSLRRFPEEMPNPGKCRIFVIPTHIMYLITTQPIDQFTFYKLDIL